MYLKTVGEGFIFNEKSKGYISFEDITSGTKVIDIEGMPLQGLEIYAIGSEGNWQEMLNTFYWTDAGWSILSSK